MSTTSASSMEINGSFMKSNNANSSDSFRKDIKGKGRNNSNKQTLKHKSNSHSNINSNKQQKGNYKKNEFSQHDQINDFKKLPKSKNNISSWVNNIYDNNNEDYSSDQANSKEKKSRSGSSGSRTKPSLNLYNNKKTSGHSSRNHHDNLYLSGDFYINANYKILTRDKLAVLAGNEKGVVPFESIERCITYTDQFANQTCPICLSNDITCGRMINCGHILCYQCLLQYIDNNEKKNAKDIMDANKKSNNNAISNIEDVKKRVLHDCPLCGDIISLKHIVPVSCVFNDGADEIITQGKHYSLQLMVRPKTSSLSLPLELGLDPELISLPLDYDPESILDLRFDNTFFITNSKEISFLYTDIEHLKHQSQLDQLLYNESDEFVIKAISAIESKIQKLTAEKQTDAEQENETISLAYVGVESLLQKYDDSNAYFYYQHQDAYANKTFLEGQDINILKKQYLQYSKFPSTLNVQVQHVVNDNQVNNNSMQYLNQLPIGTSYKLIEINLQSHVSAELYQFYKPMLKSRVKLHERIKRQENVNKIKGEKQELARLMKQITDDLNMTPFEQEHHLHEPKHLDGELPTLANLAKGNSELTKLSGSDHLDVKDYKLGDRVKVDNIWYTLKKSIWGELRFEKDKKVILTEKNGELLEMFQQQMNIK